MTDSTPAQPGSPPTAHRRRRRRSRPPNPLRVLWNEWRVEILILVLLAAGVFLVFEQMHIRQALSDGLRGAVRFLEGLSDGTRLRLEDLLQKVTLSDLVGLAIILVAAALVLSRVRWRLLTMPRFTVRQCPRCQGPLHRIHRRSLDRAINLCLPVRRYRCDNRACGWRGLRTGRSADD
jgi:hypothetical protein